MPLQMIELEEMTMVEISDKALEATVVRAVKGFFSTDITFWKGCCTY